MSDTLGEYKWDTNTLSAYAKTVKDVQASTVSLQEDFNKLMADMQTLWHDSGKADEFVEAMTEESKGITTVSEDAGKFAGAIDQVVLALDTAEGKIKTDFTNLATSINSLSSVLSGGGING